jgi:transposase
MSYVIKQKIGKNVYLYEATPYWDKNKKQARQKRVYLGKECPETGSPLTPRKDKKPQSVCDYGHLYTVQKIAAQLGLIEVLMKNFPDHWEEVLHLAFYRLLENKPFYLQKLWAESTSPNQAIAMSSQYISKLLQKIGVDSNSRFGFFEDWIKKQNKSKCLFLDITSLSSYSQQIDFVEWGYNRDKEKLPQINLGLVQAYPDGLPLFYQLYPGSIADVSTLKNVIKQAAGLRLDVSTMVMDKGFYSLGNLLELEGNKTKFIIPLPATTKAAKTFLSKHQTKITSPLNAFHRKDRTIFHIKDNISIGDNTFVAHLYLDEQKKTEEMNLLFKQLENLEFQVTSGNFCNKEDLIDFMGRTMRGSTKFYSIRMNKGSPILTRKRNALTFRLNQAGKMILITNNNKLSRDDVLSLYRQKDNVEKMFDIMKNEIDDARLHVQSRAAMEGAIFVLFVSLLIYASLTRKMQDAKLFKKYTLVEMMGELKKVRVVTMSHGSPHLTEISKKQREIWEALHLPLPVAPSY